MQNQLIIRSFAGVAMVFALGFGPVAPALAADEQAGRYVLKKTDDGFLRLDTRSGDVSMCAKIEDKWGCRSMDENGGDIRDRVVELERENTKLRDQIASLKSGNGTVAPARRKFEVPSDEDIDKAMTFVDKLVRKFKDVLNTIKEEEKGTQL